MRHPQEGAIPRDPSHWRKAVLCCSDKHSQESSMRQILIPICTVIAAFTLPVATPAQSEQELPSEWVLCINEGKVYPPDIAADGCTAVIRSGKRVPRELAVAFTNRGLAYRALGDFERALADYDSAIKLDPSYAAAFNNRGAARRD